MSKGKKTKRTIEDKLKEYNSELQNLQAALQEHRETCINLEQRILIVSGAIEALNELIPPKKNA